MEGFPLQSLDEYLRTRLARACGLKAAAVSYDELDGVPAIVVERYDRTIQTNGTVARTHQEDLCQALGYLSKDKYVPAPTDILPLLKSDASGQSAYDFVSALFFNYLIGAALPWHRITVRSQPWRRCCSSLVRKPLDCKAANFAVTTAESSCFPC